MLTPDYYYDSVHEIPYEEFWKEGLRGLIFDIDNTLTAFDQKLPSEEIVDLINRLQRMGYKLCLVTNNTNRRLTSFNEHMQLPGIANALKPLTRGLCQAMEKMSTQPYQTAIIGDQLLSDIWGGRNARITTIMVRPLTERDFLFVRAKRLIERLMLRKFFAERGIKPK